MTTNHPNRSRSESVNPSPEEIRAARTDAALTQSAASALVHSTLNAWQKWEDGSRRMHPAIWELFKIKAAQSPPHAPS